jgi:hypothetical protein
MADPFLKVSMGDQIRFSAAWYNAATDAARAFQKRGIPTPSAIVSTYNSTIIKIRNDTGNPLVQFSVVGLNGPVFTPTETTEEAFLRDVVFSAITPAIDSHRRRFAVTLDAAPAGDPYGSGYGYTDDTMVIRAYIAGVCHVLVNLKDPSHGYANITDGLTDYMTSSRFGHARILWSESEDTDSGYSSGVQWATVMLGVTGSCFAIGKANGSIPGRSGSTFGEGKVDLYCSSSGSYMGGTAEGPVETIWVLNAAGDSSATIATGTYCAVAWDADDVAWVSPLECPS